MKIILLILLHCGIVVGPIYAQWSKIYDDFSFSEGYFNCLEITPDSTIFFGTAYNIYRSNSLGATWELVYDEAGATAIDCYNNDTCYCAGYYDDIGPGGVSLRTTNGGDDWELPTTEPFYYAANMDVFAVNGHRVFLAGLGLVQFTDNGFLTVDGSIPSGTIESVGAISCANKDTCICVSGSFIDDVGEDYRIYKSTDGGNSWVENISAIFGRDIVHINDELIYLLERFALIKSFDGGETWDTVKIYSGIPGSHYVAMKFVDENFGYLAEQFDVQDSIAIYKTENGGNDWIATEINDMPIGIFDIDCINKDHCFFIGGLGEIYSTTNGGIPTFTNNENITKINISPNPATDYVKLSLLGSENITSIVTFNLTGEMVDLKFDINYVAFTKDLPPSFYLTAITVNDKEYYISWIKQ